MKKQRTSREDVFVIPDELAEEVQRQLEWAGPYTGDCPDLDGAEAFMLQRQRDRAAERQSFCPSTQTEGLSQSESENGVKPD